MCGRAVVCVVGWCNVLSRDAVVGLCTVCYCSVMYVRVEYFDFI